VLCSFLLHSSNFRESTDGRSLVVNFELPDVDKQDIHISFQRNKLVLTWETAELTEWDEEDGIILREQVRRMYHRTLPLPEGTRVRGEILL
jgi:HSP20 family molecular chaperone IbpA